MRRMVKQQICPPAVLPPPRPPPPPPGRISPFSSTKWKKKKKKIMLQINISTSNQPAFVTIGRFLMLERCHRYILFVISPCFRWLIVGCLSAWTTRLFLLQPLLPFYSFRCLACWKVQSCIKRLRCPCCPVKSSHTNKPCKTFVPENSQKKKGQELLHCYFCFCWQEVCLVKKDGVQFFFLFFLN